MAPDWIAGDPEDLRAWRNRQPDVLSPVIPPGVTEQPLSPDGPFRGGILFRPVRPARTGVLVHFHGGGFIVGSPHTHRIVAATLCDVTGLCVVSAAYRLAPEHPLPAQAEDAAAALRHVAAHLDGPIYLSGDSAGALVALWGHHRVGSEPRERIAGAMLFYGVFGMTRTGCLQSAPDAEAEALGLGPEAIASYYDKVDPLIQIGSDPDLTPNHPAFYLPVPLMLVAAETDPVAPETHNFHTACAGLSHLLVVEGKGHGFLSTPVPDTMEREAIRAATALLFRQRKLR